MATVESSVAKTASATLIGQLPALLMGDRLTRAEFERRFSALPNIRKVLAVLQEGLASPQHANFVAKLHDASGHNPS